MSYCGACGSFFYPGCPRVGEGTCTPAPNPFEERRAKLDALTVAATATIAGMKCANASCRAIESPDKYDDADFLKVATDLLAEVAILEAS